VVALLWRRAASVVPILLLVSVVAFFILQLSPGDPVRLMLGENATVEGIHALRQELGLDRPLYVQYGLFLLNSVHGNLGRSYRTYQPVSSELTQRFVKTMELGLVAYGLSVVIGIPLGVLSALRRNSWLDWVVRILSLASVSIPVFWFGILLIFVFAVDLRWLPSSGSATPAAIILPAIALSTYSLGILLRMTRTSVAEILHQDYLRTAYAKGLRTRSVIVRHAFRNAMIPIVTLMGLQLGGVISGAVVTETVFAWPGVGRYMIDSLFSRDYPAMRACILLFAWGFLLVNLLVDLCYVYLDPRIRYS
jgi:ABC-type dipeptide/oligopeptide/nickel transport system permease component